MGMSSHLLGKWCPGCAGWSQRPLSFLPLVCESEEFITEYQVAESYIIRLQQQIIQQQKIKIKHFKPSLKQGFFTKWLGVFFTYAAQLNIQYFLLNLGLLK